MEYFVLERDDRVIDVITPVWEQAVWNKQPRKDELDQGGNAEMLHLRSGKGEYPDYLDSPVPLLSNRLKYLVDMAAPGVLKRPVVIGNPELLRQELYWVISPPVLDVLGEKTEFNKDGTISRIFIDKEKAGRHTLFRPKGIREPIIIVNLALAEAFLRRESIGFCLKSVEVEERKGELVENA